MLRVHLQLAKDAAQVVANGALGNEEHFGDQWYAVALHDEPAHLALAASQSGHSGGAYVPRWPDYNLGFEGTRSEDRPMIRHHRTSQRRRRYARTRLGKVGHRVELRPEALAAHAMHTECTPMAGVPGAASVAIFSSPPSPQACHPAMVEPAGAVGSARWARPPITMRQYASQRASGGTFIALAVRSRPGCHWRQGASHRGGGSPCAHPPSASRTASAHAARWISPGPTVANPARLGLGAVDRIECIELAGGECKGGHYDSVKIGR